MSAVHYNVMCVSGHDPKSLWVFFFSGCGENVFGVVQWGLGGVEGEGVATDWYAGLFQSPNQQPSMCLAKQGFQIIPSPQV